MPSSARACAPWMYPPGSSPQKAQGHPPEKRDSEDEGDHGKPHADLDGELHRGPSPSLNSGALIV